MECWRRSLGKWERKGNAKILYYLMDLARSTFFSGGGSIPSVLLLFLLYSSSKIKQNGTRSKYPKPHQHPGFLGRPICFLTFSNQPENTRANPGHRATGSMCVSMWVKPAASVHHSLVSVGGCEHPWGHSHHHGCPPALWYFHLILQQACSHWNQCRKHCQRTEVYPVRIPITFFCLLNLLLSLYI